LVTVAIFVPWWTVSHGLSPIAKPLCTKARRRCGSGGKLACHAYENSNGTGHILHMKRLIYGTETKIITTAFCPGLSPSQVSSRSGRCRGITIADVHGAGDRQVPEGQPSCSYNPSLWVNSQQVIRNSPYTDPHLAHGITSPIGWSLAKMPSTGSSGDRARDCDHF
jgi:hypothetical protein